ncbi:reverse transcriptase domain-containing protein, partial [Tanacetum coccineum]
LDINYFRHFLDILRNYDPIDDEPMWAANRVVASTPGSAITILETANEFAIKALFDQLLGEIRAFSQPENESLTDAWLRMKEMLRNCHGHNLSKGNIIKIFYHGLSEITQEVLNALPTFQRCMLAIFHNMIEESIEVFMDDFSVFGDSFDKCLNNLDKMLQRCKDAHLVLNWEKCHFMVKEGIVLGHKVSGVGLEVDKAKIDVISKLPPLLILKVLEAFLDMPILLLEEFDIEIKDIKGTENVAADHLSRIENEEISEDSEVDDKFLGETLMEINTGNEPWFTNFSNYLVADIIPKGMTYQQKNKFFSDLKHYFWEEPYLFKGIDFMGPFPKSHKFEYILVVVYYVSKWAEAQALLTNDARVVITFLKKLFWHFGMPKAPINDQGTHFCNKIMEKTMKIYGVNHHFSTSYHPQTSGQLENTNRAIKRILEKTVKDNLAIWSRKLDDALWAFCTAYKTPTGTTPYKLIYGKNYHLPFEIEHRAYWALKNCNPDLIHAGENECFSYTN